MSPLEPSRKPSPHTPALNHIGLWVSTQHVNQTSLDRRSESHPSPSAERKHTREAPHRQIDDLPKCVEHLTAEGMRFTPGMAMIQMKT